MKSCELCARGPQVVNSRSHSNIATKRKQWPNLQSKKIKGKRVRLCVNCIKKMTKLGVE